MVLCSGKAVLCGVWDREKWGSVFRIKAAGNEMTYVTTSEVCCSLKFVDAELTELSSCAAYSSRIPRSSGMVFL